MKKERVFDYYNEKWTDSEVLMRAYVSALRNGFVMSDSESNWNDLRSGRRARHVSSNKSSIHQS